ncbi:MAG: TetR family transcriptional regulator [Hyphomicrobium sp.]
MTKKADSYQRREESLSRDRIIEASLALLDESGESGLTFRALSEKLATGPGAIYWHIESKSELFTAAADAIISRATAAPLADATPEAAIRTLALGMFDAIDAHPWIGSALSRAPGRPPMVRILERMGQQVRALGVQGDAQWEAVSVLLNYILGVAGRNAANGQFGRKHELDRTDFLNTIAMEWLQLDPDAYPFTRSIAHRMRTHDDRVDFLAGIDLILKGISSTLTP